MTDPTPREKLEKPTLIYPFAAAPETGKVQVPYDVIHADFDLRAVA